MASRLASLFASIRALPPTPFRSSGQPQLSEAFEAIAARSFGLPNPPTASSLESHGELLTEAQQGPLDSAAHALKRIEDCAAMKEFPLSNTMLHPSHDPHYYDRMRDGVHRSAQGIGRSWWKRFFQVKGQA